MQMCDSNDIAATHQAAGSLPLRVTGLCAYCDDVVEDAEVEAECWRGSVEGISLGIISAASNAINSSRRAQ